MSLLHRVSQLACTRPLTCVWLANFACGRRTPQRTGSNAFPTVRKRSMRYRGHLFLIAALWPPFVWAGPIYGSIFFNGAALRGAQISVSCGGRLVAQGATLDDGSYRISLAQEGRCIFSVTSPSFQGQANAEVVSSTGAAEYKFAVVARPGGGFELRRQ